jgi:Major Facilitator Superfamily
VAEDLAWRRPGGWVAKRLQASPYWPAVSHPVLRRLLPGLTLSALGDGMSAVAIAWLALRLAAPSGRGLWVGAAVAAYSLPGAVGAVALRRWMRGRGGARLAGVNAIFRSSALGAIGCLALAHVLDPVGYVCLLGVSSLLSAWGLAGRYTLIADALPEEHRVAGNTVFGVADQLSYMIGPALAGVLTAAAGPAVVIALDAASWAVLAVSYARAGPLVMAGRPSAERTGAGGTGLSGWAVISANQALLGLLALSFAFYFLYGPVEVALPLHVAIDLHGSAPLLGTFWAVFGAGALVGELSAPFLRRFPVWPTMTGIVFGWGMAIVPLGLDTPLWVALTSFCAGALIWGPWMSLSMAVFQDAIPPTALSQVLAVRGALMTLASPVGTALGGPLVAALGARGTLLASGLTTVALAVMTTVALVWRRRRADGRAGRAAG